MQLLIECTTEFQDQLIQNFCVFTCERLEIADQPSFTFVEHTGGTSFGSYQPSEEAIIVAVAGRHTSDILRTLGHELVHHKQLSEGENEMTLEQLEYEANAVAGMLMRDYNKLHPEMFGLLEPTEPPPGSIADSQGSTFPDVTRPSGPINMAEAKIKETDSDTLKLLKLQNQALRAFPSSPKQREIQKQIEALRKKMKTQGTLEYHTTLNEDDSDISLASRKPNKGRNFLKFFARGTKKAIRNKGKRIPVTKFGMTAAEKAKLIKEDGIVNSAGSGGVAGIGVGPQGEPGFSKKNKPKILKRFKRLREEMRTNYGHE